jgi:uncharacterized OsmC-like protein
MPNELNVDPSQPYSTITANLVRDFQVQVVIDRSYPGKGHGPWSLIIDELPEVGSSGVGPSPVQVVMAGLAARTVVTLMGVARRRKMPLEAIRVKIITNRLFSGKMGAEEAAAEGKPVQTRRSLKRITLQANLSDRDLQILKNTAKHCPVSRLFGQGAVEFVDAFSVKR